MPEINTVRRYYLLAYRDHLFVREHGIAQAYLAKQQETTGTALPVAFPYLSELATKQYTTQEDLDGADVEELRSVGFTVGKAKEILAAFQSL